MASSNSLRQQLALKPANAAPAIPWRRANVKHTSNELYVDIVETLSVTLAPSGRPLAAFANGSILFTAKISGVPDLLLNLTVPSGKHAIDRVLELPTFHPCVRLARWKEKPGELSFVPPDGKFLLAGYEVNLLPSDDITSQSMKNLNLPAFVEVDTSLGPTGCDFEARLILKNVSGSTPNSSSQSRIGLGGPSSGSGRSTPSLFSGIGGAGGLGASLGGGGGSSTSPSLSEVIATIPMPRAVRNLTDLRASRGEASFSPIDHLVTWRISTKDAAAPGTATLRCTVVGPLSNRDGDDDEDEDDDPGAEGLSALGFDPRNGEYNENEDGEESGGGGAYQASSSLSTPNPPKSLKPSPTDRSGKGGEKAAQDNNSDQRDQRKLEQNAALMPISASVSFSIKGWLASGIRVESLVVDARRSRGLGEGVKPVKGVKYLTVSRNGGVETRC